MRLFSSIPLAKAPFLSLADGLSYPVLSCLILSATIIYVYILDFPVYLEFLSVLQLTTISAFSLVAPVRRSYLQLLFVFLLLIPVVSILSLSAQKTASSRFQLQNTKTPDFSSIVRTKTALIMLIYASSPLSISVPPDGTRRTHPSRRITIGVQGSPQLPRLPFQKVLPACIEPLQLSCKKQCSGHRPPGIGPVSTAEPAVIRGSS